MDDETDNACHMKPEPKCRFPEPFEVFPGSRWLLNPGNIEGLHLKQRQICPVFFDGIGMEYSNTFTPNKTVFGSWLLSHTNPSGFNIGGFWANKCNANILESPLIKAQFNPMTMASNAAIIYFPFPFLRLEAELQRLRNATSKNFTAELTTSSSTLTLKFYNPTNHRGRICFSALRKMTKRFDFGGELLLEWDGRVVMANTALAARYGTNHYEFAATASKNGMDLSYWKKLTKDIQMGSSLAFNKNTHKAIANICYQWQFKDATVRGLVDSDWSVGFSYFRLIFVYFNPFYSSLLITTGT